MTPSTSKSRLNRNNQIPPSRKDGRSPKSRGEALAHLGFGPRPDPTRPGARVRGQGPSTPTGGPGLLTRAGILPGSVSPGPVLLPRRVRKRSSDWKRLSDVTRSPRESESGAVEETLGVQTASFRPHCLFYGRNIWGVLSPSLYPPSPRSPALPAPLRITVTQEKRPAGVSRRGVTDTVAAGLRHRGARGRHKRTAKSHQSESVLRRGEGLEHPDLEKSQSELKLELQSDGQSDLCPALIGGRDPDSPPPAALRSFFQSLRSKVASFTEIVMSPVRLLKHSEALLGGPQGTPGPRARIRLQLDGLPAPGPAPSPPPAPALCTPATPESVGEQVFRTPPEGLCAQEGADTSPVGGAGEEGRGAGRAAPPGAPPAPQESVEGEGQHKEGGVEGRGRRSEGGAEGEGQHKEGGVEGRGRRSEGGAEGRGRRSEGGAEGRTPTRASARRASWGVSETKREVPTAGAGRRAASLSPGGALWGSLALKAAVVRISRQPLPASWGARSGRGPPAVRRPPDRGLCSAPGPSGSGSPAPKRGRGALRLPGAPETAPLLRRAVVELGCRVRLPPGGGGTAPPSSAGRRGRPPGRRRRRGGAAGTPPADPPGRPPRAPRLLRSFSCPEIRAAPGPPAPSCPAPPPRPSPARRPRRHTVCSLELAREIAPLCLRKEVHPRPCCAPCPSSCCSPSSPSSSSLSARATCFLSSPLAFLSRRHGDQERGGARGDLTSCSSPAPAFLVPGSSACVPAGPSCSPETPSCYRQGPAEQAGGERSGVVTLQEDGGDFSLELEVTETRDERLLSDSVIKGDCLQPGTRGMVSRFRIRKTLPKPPANLTPMGLPRPVRLKKKQFSLEEIYTNKNFRLPPEGRLETIFEVPVSGRDGALSLIGPRRLRRALDFPEAGVARKPRRLLGSCRRAGAARTRRAGRSPLSPSLPELDSLLSAKLDQLEAWIALEESGAPSDP